MTPGQPRETHAVLGFGTWPLGGRSYGHVAPEDALDCLKLAADAGITLFDTADIYGDGSVETLLGRAFKDASDIQIVTKVGYLRESDAEQDFSMKGVLQRVQASAKRLRRERIDAVLFHSPPREALAESSLADTALRLSDSGLVAEFGVSVRSFRDVDLALALPRITVVEVILNLLDQRPIDDGVLERAVASGVRVIARVPLCFGFLTGKYRSGSVFSVGQDHRARWPREQLDAWAQGATRFSFMHDDRRSLAQSALAFCACTTGVAAVIPGMKSRAQVVHNVAAMEAEREVSTAEYDQARRTWDSLRHIPPR